MKKLTIALVLFFATGATIGMNVKMNTEYNTNPLLTKEQYDRIIDRWENIANSLDRLQWNAPKDMNQNDRNKSIEMLTKRSNNADSMIHDKPYRSYTDEEIKALLWVK